MTLIDVVGRTTQTPYGLRAVGLESGLMSVAGHTRFTVDAVRLLWHALHFTHEALKPPNATPSLPGTFKAGAVEIMTGIREITLLHFGAAARDRLRRMGLVSGEDVAELMAEMIRQKIFALSEGESLEDFTACRFDLAPP